MPADPEPVAEKRRPPLLVDSAATVTALTTLASCLEKAKEGIDSAVAANAAVVQDSAGDLKPAYAAFCSAVDALDADRNALSSATGALRGEASALLARWKDAIEALDDVELREIGQERSASAEACVESLLQDEGNAPEAMRALLAVLTDHRLFLGIDLNSDAARSLADDDEKLGQLSAAASSVFDRMLEATQSCIDSLSPQSE